MDPNVWPAGMSYQQMADTALKTYGGDAPTVNLGLEYDPQPPRLPVARMVGWGAVVLALYVVLNRSI